MEPYGQNTLVVEPSGKGSVAIAAEAGTLYVKYEAHGTGATVLFGINGAPPTNPLPTGVTTHFVDDNSFNISYEGGTGHLKFGWGYGAS